MEQYKGIPLDYTQRDIADLAERRPFLRDFPTPLVTLSDDAVAHNIETMAQWCEGAGVGIAPHGKTTMSRSLWQRQLDAGAWGITVATAWQASVALEWGVPRVMLANALVQAASIAPLAAHGDRLTVWADSPDAVAILTERLSPTQRLDVLVELGVSGGRTGARGQDAALRVARAIAAAPGLRLAGVAGYEGAVAHDASATSLAAVRAYLLELVHLHEAIEAERLYAPGDPVVVTAGGSAYFDEVADVLGPLRDLAGARGRVVEVLLRSGAYIAHDDGLYRDITPFRRRAGVGFRPALHGWATVVSHPEPGLVIVDAGKRDLPFDEGLPEPQALRRRGESRSIRLDDAFVTAINDQHTFVAVPEGRGIRVGDVIRFGLSHPCTAFDKWRSVVVIDDARGDEPRVRGLLDTTFG